MAEVRCYLPFKSPIFLWYVTVLNYIACFTLLSCTQQRTVRDRVGFRVKDRVMVRVSSPPVHLGPLKTATDELINKTALYNIAEYVEHNLVTF